MKQKSLLILIAVMALSSCRNQFTTGSYESRKFDHRTVAVVPPVSAYTGKIPEDVTKEDIQLIEDEEALRFQDMIHTRLIFESGSRNGDVGIDFISPVIVNRKLEEAGMTVREASLADPTELGEILGVDIIVRGSLKMNRFMSDLSSMKIEAAETVLRGVLSVAKLPVGLPGGTHNVNRTYLIQTGSEVVDVKDGIVVWKTFSSRNADWNYQPEQAIMSMCAQMANQFAYRNREFKKRR